MDIPTTKNRSCCCSNVHSPCASTQLRLDLDQIYAFSGIFLSCVCCYTLSLSQHQFQIKKQNQTELIRSCDTNVTDISKVFSQDSFNLNLKSSEMNYIKMNLCGNNTLNWWFQSTTHTCTCSGQGRLVAWSVVPSTDNNR